MIVRILRRNFTAEVRTVEMDFLPAASMARATVSVRPIAACPVAGSF